MAGRGRYRCCGHLYAFHRLCGSAETAFEDAVDELRDSGHEQIAVELERTVMGRNPLPRTWSFQMGAPLFGSSGPWLRARRTQNDWRGRSGKFGRDRVLR